MSATRREAAHPQGPLVVLGASYARGWDLAAVGAVKVINRGLAGEQSSEMLARFERDVAQERPRAVLVWGFINDFFRAGQRVYEAKTRIKDSYSQMIACAHEHGIEVILSSEMTIVYPDTWSALVGSWVGAIRGHESYQDRINKHVRETNAWLTQLARQERILFLDLGRALEDEDGRRRRVFSLSDGSHISPSGYVALTQFASPILDAHFKH